MFSWLYNIHKCFGNKRQKSEEPESASEQQHKDLAETNFASTVKASSTGIPTEYGIQPYYPTKGRQEAEGKFGGAEAIEVHAVSNAEDLIRASPDSRANPNSRKRSHPEPSPEDLTALADHVNCSASFRTAAPLAKYQEVHMSLGTSEPASLGRSPPRHDLPRNKQAAHHRRKSSLQGSDLALPIPDVPSSVREDAQGSSEAEYGICEVESGAVEGQMTPAQEDVEGAHSSQIMGHTPPARPSSPRDLDRESDVPAFANKNADPHGEEKVSISATRPSASPSPRPQLQIQLPALSHLKAASLQTPNSPQNLHFVVDNGDSYGPPNISGVQNLQTCYREDKRLRVHDTPFEIRVERFMHKEQEYKARMLERGNA